MSEAAARPPVRINALEAATETGGVALLEGSRLLAERTFGESQRSASALLVALDELLRTSRLELEEFDLIALSVGPGSFTGLRVGLAMALGLCFDTGRRVVPVSTLAALSTHAGEVDHIVPMLDARRGEVYAGLYGPGGHALREDRVCDPASFLASLPDEPTPYHFVGTGSLRYAGMIREKIGDRARLLSADQARPRAASVGLLGVQLASTGVSVAAADVELRYLRRPAAEVAQRAGQFPGESIT